MFSFRRWLARIQSLLALFLSVLPLLARALGVNQQKKQSERSLGSSCPEDLCRMQMTAWHLEGVRLGLLWAGVCGIVPALWSPLWGRRCCPCVLEESEEGGFTWAL